MSWYPCQPLDHDLPVVEKADISAVPAVAASIQAQKDQKQRFWEHDNLKFTGSNIWKGIQRHKKDSIKRNHIDGVEVRLLPPDHVLKGEYGLFATKKFDICDVIGEYVGVVVGNNKGGHYVATLEDKFQCDSLGIDAEKIGNEMRFINSYLNVAFFANVAMRTVYIDGMPHIVIVCTRDIDVGEEFLLDYGEAYNKAYLLPRPPEKPPVVTTAEEMRDALPFCGSDSEDEAEVHDKKESSTHAVTPVEGETTSDSNVPELSMRELSSVLPVAA